MEFLEWVFVVGAIGILVIEEIGNFIKRKREDKIKKEEEQNNLSEGYGQLKKETTKHGIMEFTRRNEIDMKRKNTPCKFQDGITYEELSNIAQKVGERIERIKNVIVTEAVIYCTVESQSGCSEWNFYVDFNDWGHVTGTYWENTENNDSGIPEHFGDMMSENIRKILKNRDIHLQKFSSYVDWNKNLSRSSDLSYKKRMSFLEILKRIFSEKKQIVSQYSSQDLLGEHIYVVVSMLKNSGYRNIKSIPIKDVGQNSDKYAFEVETVVINKSENFEKGDIFPENAKVVITYHVKQEINFPYAMDYFRKQNYIMVEKQLQRMGFSNISERKIKDLVTGWMIKDGSVEEIFIINGGKESPICKDYSYEYDAKIIITYHNYSK